MLVGAQAFKEKVKDKLYYINRTRLTNIEIVYFDDGDFEYSGLIYLVLKKDGIPLSFDDCTEFLELSADELFDRFYQEKLEWATCIVDYDED